MATDFPSVIVNATKRAAVEILHRKGIKLSDDQIRSLGIGLKKSVLEGYDGALQDGKDALEAGMGSAIVEATVSASCVLMASKAIAYAGIEIK